MELGVRKSATSPTAVTAPAISNSKPASKLKRQRAVLFKARHGLILAFFFLILIFHALAIFLFCSGFLLSRLVLSNRSQCDAPPISLDNGYVSGSATGGCWHPKRFDKAIVLVIDALRYDFTVPFRATANDATPHYFHNALPTLYETALKQPAHAVLRPFIADPPTTTLQRLKALTTGTLPTFIDAGSNFAGTAIDEDNLIEQLFIAGKRVVHLGDDTWHALFPGYFEPNLTRPFDSFNVPDLHTVDNGVIKHMFPLLQPDMHQRWDVIIGHFLGVDHAGHRYGPDHPAMADKLRQMDGVVQRVVDSLEDDTLLVVIGDHGMDVKGDHGGESDDEVEAALWMYSKRAFFGRSDAAFATPPATAKDRAVSQIDLVPTLSLLLGMPIPFNNLGGPIEEAFLGESGSNYRNIAQVNRLTAAQIRKYQQEYAQARRQSDSGRPLMAGQWQSAIDAWHTVQTAVTATTGGWKTASQAFANYQNENLRDCRALWASFDLNSMAMGIITLGSTLSVVVALAHAVRGDRAALTPTLLLWGVAGTVIGCGVGGSLSSTLSMSFIQLSAFGAAFGGTTSILFALIPMRKVVHVPFPRTFWGGLCIIVTALLCFGFSSNSFTVWEDKQLLFFLTTFGFFMLAASLGQSDEIDRRLGVVHSISFLLATRLSSFSRLCREEQMPECKSTYYVSATSSTSALWQLAIPFIVAAILPSAIRNFYIRTKNYQGSAVVWIGIALRVGLFFTAVFWILDAADDGEWYANISQATLKSTRVILAQVILGLAGAGGYATYLWASPFLLVKTEEPDPAQTTPAVSKSFDPSDPRAPVYTPLNGKAAPNPSRPKLIVLGYANSLGTRYFLLATIWLLALQLVQKPMGQGAMALCAISLLNILEVLDANRLQTSPLGPILLALLGSFHFFTTGHQAALATIQWETAFLATNSLIYPISPLLVALNTFGPHILCALAVPAIPLWKAAPRARGTLSAIIAALATHISFYAAIAAATVIEAAMLRRHLMLYRVFMPRMLLAVAALLVVDFVAALIAIGGLRSTFVSVAEVFGWSEEYDDEDEEAGGR